MSLWTKSASNIEITAEGSQHSRKTYWHLSSVYLNSACPHFPSAQWEWLKLNVSFFLCFHNPTSIYLKMKKAPQQSSKPLSRECLSCRNGKVGENDICTSAPDWQQGLKHGFLLIKHSCSCCCLYHRVLSWNLQCIAFAQVCTVYK